MWLKSFFYLQKNDRQGVIVILLFLITSLLLVFYLGGNKTSSTAFSNDSVKNQNKATTTNSYKTEKQKTELFAFDPNTADSSQFRRLGLQDWQIKNIYSYRTKGGIYRRPSDFARLYGLTKGQYEKLLPYIRIADEYRPASDFYGKENYSFYERTENKGNNYDSTAGQHATKIRHSIKLVPGQHIALNTADTTQLMKVPGIGSYYARAIINYRNRLGGFANSRQILEVGGVPESAVQYMSVGNQEVIQMEINKMSVNQMRRHPYINFYQARDIYEYRRLHGPLKDLTPLKNTGNFTDSELKRLEPYIKY